MRGPTLHQTRLQTQPWDYHVIIGNHPPLYRKALIFRRPYISQISRISLHSRTLFSAKIVSTSRDPYTSVIRMSSPQIALYKYFESSQCIYKSKRSSLRSYAVGRFHQLFTRCRGWFNKTQNSSTINMTWGRYACFSAMKSVSFSITSPSLSRHKGSTVGQGWYA